jgi:hypothetical protein
MAKLKIRIYKDGKTEPVQTITIPLSLLKIASKMAPKKVKEPLKEKGIDIGMLADIAKSGEAQGVITEIEDHEKNEKTVISIE